MASSNLIRVMTVILTAASTFVANSPRLECLCGAGAPLPVCLGLFFGASACQSPTPKDRKSCCCCDSSGPKSAVNAIRDQRSTPAAASRSTGEPRIESRGCLKQLAEISPCDDSPAIRIMVDSSVTLIAPSILNANHPASCEVSQDASVDHGGCPPNNLTILHQHFII